MRRIIVLVIIFQLLVLYVPVNYGGNTGDLYSFWLGGKVINCTLNPYAIGIANSSDCYNEIYPKLNSSQIYYPPFVAPLLVALAELEFDQLQQIWTDLSIFYILQVFI